jgi:hypothetical protein
MASYTITWSCGHTSEKQLFGPGKDRDSYIEWASLHGICPACYAIEQERQRKAKIELDKLAAQESAGRLQDQGIILPALAGTEKQIPWAKDIRAKLLDSPIAWAVKAVMERNPELVLKAKYWIDRRTREDIDWARMALPPVWNQSWTPGCPELKAAVEIIRHATYDRASNTILLSMPLPKMIERLAELAAVPIEEERPALGDYGKRDAIDNWLMCQWARNGMIDWIKARMQASMDTAADAKAVAQRATEAHQQKLAAEKQIEEAKRITELAKSSLEEAMKVVGIASLIVGAPGLIDGQEFILTDVRDEGDSVLAREKDGDEILDLSAYAWAQAHMRYLGRLADSEVKP